MSTEYPIIHVKSFGGFSLSVGDGGEAVSDARGHSKKLWSLMEYLIFCDKYEVPARELIELLWPGEGGASDPVSSLRLLVHRSRAELNKLEPYTGADLIVCRNECYSWNREYPIELDTVVFEKYCRAACSGTPEEKLENMLSAISVYKGRFMPKALHYPWVTRLAGQYHSQYISMCIRVCELLRRAGRREEILEVCKTALEIDPSREELHVAYMETLAAAERVEEALAHYRKAVSALRAEGKTPGDEMYTVYKTLSGDINSEVGNIEEIRGGIEEEDMFGAFYCEYELFKNIYRLKARETQRSGQKIVLMLFTIVPHSNVSLSYSGVMERVKDILSRSLRKEDVFARYSVSQYLILLQSCTEEDSAIVADRISQRFRESENRPDYSVHTNVLPMLPAEPPKEARERIEAIAAAE